MLMPQAPRDRGPPQVKQEKKQSLVFTAQGAPLKQVPYILRNLQTLETHRLRETIYIGRSQQNLRQGIDLHIDQSDVSRLHASITVNDQGMGIKNECRGTLHVEGFPVIRGQTREFGVGMHIRLGESSFWVVERASLFKPSRGRAEPDPLDSGEWLEVPIYRIGMYDTLRLCENWLLFVEVLLDFATNCPKSSKIAPCVDEIQVVDNEEKLCEFGPLKFQEMLNFDVKRILAHIRGEGQIIRVHLSADPLKLAEVATYYSKKEREEKEQNERVKNIC